MKPRLLVIEGGLGSESAPRLRSASWNREWVPAEHGGDIFHTATARVDVINPGNGSGPRIAVCGSRTVADRDAVGRRIRVLPPDAIVLTSRTYGTCAATRDAAIANGLHLEVWTALTDCFPTDEAAYFARDEEMIQSADQLIAFWDGSSSGTAHELEYARRIGKPVELADAAPRPHVRARREPAPRPSGPFPGGDAA